MPSNPVIFHDPITTAIRLIKNIRFREKLRKELAPKKVNLADEPQIAGALGAAIIAKKHVAVEAGGNDSIEAII